MRIRNLIKRTARVFHVEKHLQEINYKLSYFNGKSKHPRKLVITFYKKFIKRKDLVFDIGANVGERVSVFRELGAVVVAVEPQKKCVDNMKSRFCQSKDIYFENVGLGAMESEMDLFICEDDDRLSTFSTDQVNKSFFSDNTNWKNRELITITTLDVLISKYGLPSFCKIDVEGYELEVLKGLTTSIPYISFEFSSKQMDKIQCCFERLLIINKAYEFNICFGEPYHLHFSKWDCAEQILKEISHEDTRSRTHAWGDVYARLKM
jgi:FkbM family methyltransferase